MLSRLRRCCEEDASLWRSAAHASKQSIAQRIRVRYGGVVAALEANAAYLERAEAGGAAAVARAALPCALALASALPAGACRLLPRLPCALLSVVGAAEGAAEGAEGACLRCAALFHAVVWTSGFAAHGAAPVREAVRALVCVLQGYHSDGDAESASATAAVVAAAVAGNFAAAREAAEALRGGGGAWAAAEAAARLPEDGRPCGEARCTVGIAHCVLEELQRQARGGGEAEVEAMLAFFEAARGAARALGGAAGEERARMVEAWRGGGRGK